MSFVSINARNYEDMVRRFNNAGNISSEDKKLFFLLLQAYNVQNMLRSTYFQLLRIGDFKYRIIVRKAPNDYINVKFQIN